MSYRTVKLAGRAWKLPAEVPPDLMSYHDAIAAKRLRGKQPDGEELRALYERVLALFQVHQPDATEVPIAAAQLLSFVPDVYAAASPPPPSGRLELASGSGDERPAPATPKRARSRAGRAHAVEMPAVHGWGSLKMPPRLSMRQRPTVKLGTDEIGYCMHPGRPDECFRAALATVTQIPIEQVPDARIDERLEAGHHPDAISVDSWTRIANWLDHHGLQLVFHDRLPVDRERWIGVIYAPRFAGAGFRLSDHCLVMAHSEIAFDPAMSVRQRAGTRLHIWKPSEISYGITVERKEGPA